ncbi:MAG TPA: endo alpha-1,4 polygalactosaminidase, partial [Anaerolineae bacterium]|nr:endo alpha-1,4 polygalactosaminidase [Anaerolineae bacterium]
MPDSDQQILVTYRVLRGDTTSLHPPGPPPTIWPFPWVNYDEYTIPVFRAGAGEQSLLICDYEGNLWWPSPKFPDDQEEGGPVDVPAPAGVVRPAGPESIDSDGHLVLYHPDTFEEYDLWQATTFRDGDAACESWGGGLAGSTVYEAGAVDYFDVRGLGANPDTYSSGRAVGTALLAGLILPEDVESGTISHALAVAVPGLRNLSNDPYEPLASDYFHPASTTETYNYSTNSYALAAGQRIRLKQALVDEGGDPLDETQVAPITQMFLAALRAFGAYVVDNAGGFIFYAEDIHTADLHLADDEVNALIGEPLDTPLPPDKTRWQIVIEKLNEELEVIPFAYGPWTEGQDPATATIETANFEVVAPATRPGLTPQIYLPLILKDRTRPSPDWWRPPVNTTWQWQLTDLPIDQSLDVGMYDIEMFDNDASVVAALHAQGRKVICYINVGSWEDWRPDKDQLPTSVLGNDYEGWPGEKWLDIRQIDLLAPIMRARFDQCQAKGFDGIEPDNIDGYTNDTGFPLTYQDQLDYNIWLANETHA